MRFEIGPGGGFLVLIGLLGLSAAVFFLGMISGREMAQSEQGQSQLASVYPMPAGAPAASPPQAAAPAVQAPPAPTGAAAAAAPKPPARATAASEDIPPAAIPKPAQVHKPPPPTVASVPPKYPSAPAAEESDNDSSASPHSSAPADSSSSDEADTELRGRSRQCSPAERRASWQGLQHRDRRRDGSCGGESDGVAAAGARLHLAYFSYAN